MSSFKQRLGNVMNSQLNYSSSTQPQLMTPMNPDQSVGNIYTGAAPGSSARKSMNASRMSSTSNSVLSERVIRISEKINEIHSNIEKGKMGKLEEYEKKVNGLEQYFLEALDSAEKNFQVVDQRVGQIYEYLNQDRQTKEEMLKQKREELAAREQEIQEKFNLAEKQRFDIEKKLLKTVEDKAASVQADIQLESKNRNESIEHIKACLKSDFPKLEDMIRREFEDREEGDTQLEQHLVAEIQRLKDLVEEEKHGREETEETMIEMFKDMISKIKSEIDLEKSEREQAEEALLSLLEETCAKLNKSVSEEQPCERCRNWLNLYMIQRLNFRKVKLNTGQQIIDFPRNVSKILANVKKEDNRAEKRALAFVGSESTSIRKGGSIEKKDLSNLTKILFITIAIAMTAEDWETKYREIWKRFQEEKQKTEELKERMVKKQERYIAREHEYRITIDQIQQEIEERSTKPLVSIKLQNDDQLLLNGMDPTSPEQQQITQKERMQKMMNEKYINQKNVETINELQNEIDKTLKERQDEIAKELWKERSEIWQKLDQKLEDIKLQLKIETEKKKEDQYDFKEKEKELNEHLETMTQIAQKIDDENRTLMKMNSDLKIQYLSQENDRDLLLKQLIFAKKENQNLRKQTEDVKKRAEDMKINVDDDKTLNMDNSRSNLPPPSRGQQNRIPSNNISGFTNSRRNISLSAANMFTGPGRPKTAAMMGGGLPRPPTAYIPGGTIGKNNMTTTNGRQQYTLLGHRAVSANIVNNPRVKRYEDLICRLKKMLQIEKKSLRMVRTMCSKEIEIKNNLEKVLRQCVDDVKSEIQKKKSENKSIYYAKVKKGETLDDKNLTQQEREKIIEVLLSQERVLTLLYDKTFPPRPATAKIGLKNAFMNANNTQEDQLRNFNYYGQMNQEVDDIEDADVGKLEKEIEDVLKNRIQSGNTSKNAQYSNGIINISKGEIRQKSAAPGKRNLMSAAYRQNRIAEVNDDNDIADDIYEDEESSGNDIQ